MPWTPAPRDFPGERTLGEMTTVFPDRVRAFVFRVAPERPRAVGSASWLESCLLASFGVKGRSSEETFQVEPLSPLRGPRGLPQQNTGFSPLPGQVWGLGV